jgi:hypothetical protein
MLHRRQKRVHTGMTLLYHLLCIEAKQRERLKNERQNRLLLTQTKI